MGFSAALRVFALIHMWPTDNFKLISKLGLRAGSTALKKKERDGQKEGKSRMDGLSYWNICPSISVRAENPSAPFRKKTKKQEDRPHWNANNNYINNETSFSVWPAALFPKCQIELYLHLWLISKRCVNVISQMETSAFFFFVLQLFLTKWLESLFTFIYKVYVNCSTDLMSLKARRLKSP